MYSFLQTKKIPLLLLAQLLISAVAIADDPVTSDKYVSEQSWHYNLSLVYSKRTLDGTIANRTPIDNNTFGNLLATGESMNVGTLVANKWGQMKLTSLLITEVTCPSSPALPY